MTFSFWCILRNVARDSSIAPTTSCGSLFIRTTSALSMATSVPAPRGSRRRLAPARGRVVDGHRPYAILIPSAWSSLILSAFWRAGGRRARYRSRVQRRFAGQHGDADVASRRRAMVGMALDRGASVIVMRPRRRPDRATWTMVRPVLQGFGFARKAGEVNPCPP
jgi:hypothetical protein